MEFHDLDLAVVTYPEKVFYISGYPVLPTSGNPILHSLRNVIPYGVVVERSGKRHLVVSENVVNRRSVEHDQTADYAHALPGGIAAGNECCGRHETVPFDDPPAVGSWQIASKKWLLAMVRNAVSE